MALTAMIMAQAAALPAARAHAQQLLRLQPNGNEIGLESRAERWWYDRLRPSQFAMFGEWVSVSATGMLVSPGVFSWSGTLRPYIGQQNGSGTSNNFDSRNLGMSLGANLLAAFPITLAFNAHRSSGRLQAGAGGENEFFTSGGGSVLSWHNHWFPMTLDVSRRSTEDSWTSVRTLVPIRRSEVLHDVRLQAQSSKTILLINRVSYRDRLGPLTFSALDGSLDHALRWGTGSVLSTSLQAGQRDGSYPYSRNAIGERLVLRHSGRASSDFYVQRRSGSSSGIEAESRASGASFRVQNREWWHNSLSAARSGTRYRDGGSANAVYNWRSQVSARLRGPVMLNGTLGASLERLNQWATGTTYIFVVDERHTIGDDRAITLSNSRIDSGSVVLRSDDQSTLYVAEIDYRLLLIGSSVRVLVLPGSRMSVGSAIIANYRFEPLRSGRHQVGALAADLSIGTSDLLFRANESVRNANGSGNEQDAHLLSGRDRMFGVTMRHALWTGRVDVDAQHRSRSASSNNFVTDEVRVAFAPRGTDRWQSTLGIRGSTSAIASQRLTMASADAAVNVAVSSGLRALVTGEHWLWLPSEGLTERFLAGALEINWQFGRIESSIRYAMQRRSARVDNNQHRLTARLVRRF